jgi:hypothetical protein
MQNPSYSCGMWATLLQSQVGLKHVEESNALVKFQEFEMIHGRYVSRCQFFSFGCNPFS